MSTSALPPILSVFLCLSAICRAQETNKSEILDGPAFSRFKLTLSDGWQEDVAGPLYYSKEADSQSQWSVFPVFCNTRTSLVNWDEWEFLYPLLTYRRFGTESRLQLVQVISFSNGRTPQDATTHLFTLFPIYFQARSSNSRLNYTAVSPFYGHLVNRLFRDDIRFIMFPVYSETRKKDIITDNYLYPFFDRGKGEHYSGGQFWPIYGHHHETPFLTTNLMGDVKTNGGFDRRFILWPFFDHDLSGLGTANPTDIKTLVPFYSRTISPARVSKSYGWPFGYNIVDDKAEGYQERDLFWPLFIKAHGSKTEKRYFPFYSDARNADLEGKFILWPVYKYDRMHSPTLDRHRTRYFFFLYSDTIEAAPQTGKYKRRADFWPLYNYSHDLDGGERLQVFAPLEPFFPNNESILREYSPGWSIWVAEHNPQTGVRTQRLFWNLYRRESAPEMKKFSLLFGLFQYQSNPGGAQWRVCYVPFGRKKT